MRRLGAVPCGDDGTAEVCVWAPAAGSVRVLADGEVELERDGELWSGRFRGPGYRLVVDGEAWPDPCSRWQPDGVTGPSRVLDTGAFEWSDGGWAGVSLDELVIYELHVGTFGEEGTFDGVVPRLRGLRELGVTAIELMPVAIFPGERGWGYDGLYTYAVHPAYGGPAGLARLVDAAHAEGLGVMPVRTAERQAKAAKVPVSTLALGTANGTVKAKLTGGLTEIINVPADPAALRALAAATGGEAFTSSSDSGLKHVYDKLGSRLGHRRQPRELTDVFAAGGGVLMLLAAAVSAFWFRRIP